MVQMNKWVCVLAFTVVRVTDAVIEYDPTKKLLLTVYYESKSGESARFMRQQLQPAVHLLHDYISLKLVPFGTSTSIGYGRGGFLCRRGPSECLGNMVQDCALELLRTSNDIKIVDYVTCEMMTLAGTRNNMQCVANAGVAPNRVKSCVRSVIGTRLQLDSEYQTSRIEHISLPTVTINNAICNYLRQDNALEDLTGIICAKLRHTKPCQTYFNNLALKQILPSQKSAVSQCVKSCLGDILCINLCMSPDLRASRKIYYNRNIIPAQMRRYRSMWQHHKLI